MATITNPLALRPLDFLHCGEAEGESAKTRIWHRTSRAATAGWENRRNPNIAIHTALVYPLRSQLVAVEMIGLHVGLRISSLEKTDTGLSRNVISVSRFELYNNVKVIDEALDRIAYDIRKTVDYDPRGCLEFVFKRLKDDPEARICSEYAYLQPLLDGHKFPERFKKRVSPYDLQEYRAPGVVEVRGW